MRKGRGGSLERDGLLCNKSTCFQIPLLEIEQVITV